MELKRMVSEKLLAHYDWPATSTSRPQIMTRQNRFYLLKARCALVALGFQRRRIGQPPFSFLALVGRGHHGQSWDS